MRHGWRARLGRTIAPPRFLGFLALLPLAALGAHALLPAIGWTRAFVIGFDVAAAAFLLSLLPLLGEKGAAAIRRHADANQANRSVVLAAASMVSVVVLAAVAGDLPAVRKGDVAAGAQLVASLLLAWLFANSVYALHYAHDYYTAHPEHGRDCGGLDFPGDDAPGYIDFAYFSFTLGMTFQTSDVAVTSTRMRGFAVLHSFAAFVFNIGVIAFTINVLGGAGN